MLELGIIMQPVPFHTLTMFDNSLFESWLDQAATTAMERVTKNEELEPNDMMILVLKAQTNHIAHLNKDLKEEMIPEGGHGYTL